MILKDLIQKPVIPTGTECYGGEPCMDGIEETPKVDIVCDTCDGDGFIPATSYPDREVVNIICMECLGEGHYEEDAYVE
jgi:DnaJ-class molecular chaperone